jgi:NAD-dependent SIR2 family protein deacetylase
MSAQACKCGGQLKTIQGMAPPSSISNAYIPAGGLASQVQANKSTMPKMSLNDMKQSILAAKPQTIDSCIVCRGVINSQGGVLQTQGGYLHEECLKCSTCHKKIDNSKGFLTRGSTFHHPECVAPKCHKCSKPVSAETFVVFDDKQYHPNVISINAVLFVQ